MANTSQDSASAESPPKKRGDLLPRVITAVVMVPILLVLILIDQVWPWSLFIGAAVVVGLYEFYDMLQREEPKQVRLVSTGIGTLFLVAVYLFVGRGAVFDVGEHEVTVLLGGLAFVVWSGFLYNMMRDREIARVANTVTSTLAGVLYVGLPFLFVALYKRDFGIWGGGFVLLNLSMCWASDTGAYFTGRAFGKRKLAPIVSPKKSVEGALGGLASTIAAVFLIRALLLPWMGVVDALVLAIVGNVLAQTGDLCESLIKRSTGVKDSGTIIHGHGGMLDRVDAVIFVAPWVYLYGLVANGAVLLG